MRPYNSCVCPHINSIQTKTRFIILMHPMEYKKEKNGTGRITNLQLKNSEIIVGVDFSHNKRVNDIIDKKEVASYLLYPGKESFNLSSRKKSEIVSSMSNNPHIFILDGTWPCARKMLKLSKNLQNLKRVSFDNSIKSKFIIKQQPNPLCLSSIESVYTVLNLLKQAELENCKIANFLLPFQKMVDFQVSCILKLNNNDLTTDLKVDQKKSYKKKTQRNIIFEK